MVPEKQNIPINFAQGLDTKTDPFQVPIGKFLNLENSIFTKGGMLQKRNGFASISSLPAGGFNYSHLTTFSGNLTAAGNQLAAYNEASASWVNKGSLQPCELSTTPLVRNNLNQQQCDAVVSTNGLICTVYTENNGASLSYKYAIADYSTGQNIVAPTLIPVTSGAISGSPRVFLLGNYFVIVYTNTITATAHLQYVAISTFSVTSVTTPQDIAAVYIPASTVSWDGFVLGQALFIAYNSTTGGQNIRVTYLTASNAASGASPAPAAVFAGRKATIMSVTADVGKNHVWASFYDSTSSTGYSLCVDQNLNTVTAPTEIITTGTILNLTSVAQNAVVNVFYEVSNTYSYDGAIHSNFVSTITCSEAAAVGTAAVVIRSLGLASRAFLINSSTTSNTYPTLSAFPLPLISGTLALDESTNVLYVASAGAWVSNQVPYFLGAYSSPYQPTYFLIQGLSLQATPVVVAELAYQNGGGYLTAGLPSALIQEGKIQIAYLYKDLIAAVNKTTNPAAGSQVNGIYSQTGINLVSFDLTTSALDTAEIGNNLNLSGGFLWMYDGLRPVENNFFVYPDSIEATWSATGGSIVAKPDAATNTNAYWYQVTYEWTDNQGNAFRSAPSIPIPVTTTGAGTAGSITVNVPYLRLTYKTASPVKIVIYRWSVAQQIYYQVTSISQPTLNLTTSDSVAYVDTLADATILGNNILYTTGGVLENISAPSTNVMTLFDNRLWLIDSEDKNLLWYSKQVIEATPVEMSDLLTIYVAPSTGAQGSTGVMTAIAPIDDKLIIFKENAIYYINGSGPDNTGSNSQYSQPIFVTSTIGCINQQSIVFMPAGLMFQSDKGIWLLDRNLGTQYIGAAVESFTASATVESALNIPGTNQVRFTMDSGITLMYDYYFGQWGTFVGIPGVSSALYKDLHTFLNAQGSIYQESPGKYLDGSNPVNLAFTTGWINPAGLQGYIRSYWFYLLGVYITPHKLNVQIAYDYNSQPEASVVISPTNFSPTYGLPGPYGQGNPYGGPSAVEDWRIFIMKRCQSFQISITEVYDGSFGVPAGAGLTLSGLNLVLGVKKGWRNIGSVNTVGAG